MTRPLSVNPQNSTTSASQTIHPLLWDIVTKIGGVAFVGFGVYSLCKYASNRGCHLPSHAFQTPDSLKILRCQCALIPIETKQQKGQKNHLLHTSLDPLLDLLASIKNPAHALDKNKLCKRFAKVYLNENNLIFFNKSVQQISSPFDLIELANDIKDHPNAKAALNSLYSRAFHIHFQPFEKSQNSHPTLEDIEKSLQLAQRFHDNGKTDLKGETLQKIWELMEKMPSDIEQVQGFDQIAQFCQTTKDIENQELVKNKVIAFIKANKVGNKASFSDAVSMDISLANICLLQDNKTGLGYLLSQIHEKIFQQTSLDTQLVSSWTQLLKRAFPKIGADDRKHYVTCLNTVMQKLTEASLLPFNSQLEQRTQRIQILLTLAEIYQELSMKKESDNTIDLAFQQIQINENDKLSIVQDKMNALKGVHTSHYNNPTCIEPFGQQALHQLNSAPAYLPARDSAYFHLTRIFLKMNDKTTATTTLISCFKELEELQEDTLEKFQLKLDHFVQTASNCPKELLNFWQDEMPKVLATLERLYDRLNGEFVSEEYDRIRVGKTILDLYNTEPLKEPLKDKANAFFEKYRSNFNSIEALKRLQECGGIPNEYEKTLMNLLDPKMLSDSINDRSHQEFVTQILVQQRLDKSPEDFMHNTAPIEEYEKRMINRPQPRSLTQILTKGLAAAGILGLGCYVAPLVWRRIEWIEQG